MTERSSGQKRQTRTVLLAATVVCVAIGVGWRGFSSPQSALGKEPQGGPPKVQRLPDDLVAVPDAKYASLEGLAPGSQEAQERQRQAVQQLGLPLEVKTRRTGIMFRLVPAGSFTMGSRRAEQDALVEAGIAREKVQGETEHQVALSKPFYCAKFEVTQDQWEHVMGSNPSHFKNASKDAPVEYVSWEDCEAFVKKLCQMEEVPEGTYQLLTEAEWEYACRAGTETAFCCGNNLEPSGANFDGRYVYGGARPGEYRQRTMAVGSFRPNGWGLYDMHGNVSEWCQDCHAEYPSWSVTDPLGRRSGGYQVYRGGSWINGSWHCRSARREGDSPGTRTVDRGLRLGRTTLSSERPRPAYQVVQRLPDDLVAVADAPYASLDGLAPGSREAQERQRQAVWQVGLPLEVKTRKTGIVFRLIPPGTSTMGSPQAEQDALIKIGVRPRDLEDETAHPVILETAFYCGKFEVTQGQWEMVMGSNPSYFTKVGKDAPVEGVSWFDCQTFLKKLCQLEGVPERTYLLLSEGVWEYACRAGTQTAFCYADEIDPNMANFSMRSDNFWRYGGDWSRYRWLGQKREETTVRVGSFPPNAWGLYDMHGNVREWCQDQYLGPYLIPSEERHVVVVPLTPDQILRVNRGGDYGDGTSDCRSAKRSSNNPGTRALDLGLRLGRAVPSVP